MHTARRRTARDRAAMQPKPKAFARHARCRETHNVCKGKRSCGTLRCNAASCPDERTEHVWGRRPELDSALRNCHGSWVFRSSSARAADVKLILSRLPETVWVRRPAPIWEGVMGKQRLVRTSAAIAIALFAANASAAPPEAASPKPVAPMAAPSAEAKAPVASAAPPAAPAQPAASATPAPAAVPAAAPAPASAAK